MMPINRHVFGQMREYIAKGMYIDDNGYVWTALGEAIVIRSRAGKVVVAVNRHYFLADTEADANSIANSNLAGDKLIILPTTRLIVVQLAEEVVCVGTVLLYIEEAVKEIVRNEYIVHLPTYRVSTGTKTIQPLKLKQRISSKPCEA